MVMTKPSGVQIHLADMGRTEAEEITQVIKDNFDSLGAMLSQARDRKAYKALGYRSFERYCQSEFGKSASSAYQLIEDARVISQLEERISQNYGEKITLNFPSSHLQPLKEIADIDEKLKVIEYAKKLATAENRKATKKDLEIAVFQISGKRSEDFRAAIQGLGFTKGVQVEVFKSLNKDRGIVEKIDKGGKIYVEFHYGGNAAIPYDAADLRILSEDEQPAQPLNEDIASKGDRVTIFSPALKGKEGTIFQWKSGKQALVMVDGQNSPIDVAYAEMETIIKKTEEKNNVNWESELVWESGKNTYYYFPKEDKIYSNQWPTGLTLNPYTHSGTPIEFVENWENRFSHRVIESLATPARTKALVLAQALEEGKEFAADLVNSLLELFPDISNPESASQKALGISFARTINELMSGKKTQTRRAWQDDYAKNFIRYFDENIPIPALDKGRHRGGHELGFIRLTQRPYQQYLSEMTATDLQEEGGMVATAQEFIDTFFEGQNKLVWVLHFEFLSSDAEIVQENQRLRQQLLEAETAIQSMVTASRLSPGDTAAHSEFLAENIAETSAPGDTAAHSEFLAGNITETSDPEEDTASTDSCKEILKANHFVSVPYRLDGSFKGSWRGWKFFLHTPSHASSLAYAGLSQEKREVTTTIDLANEKKEMFTRGIDLSDENKIIEWVKGIVDQIVNTPELPLEILTRLEVERKKANKRIDSSQSKKYDLYARQGGKINKKEIEKLERDIDTQYNKIEQLNKFSQFREGQTVCHKRNPLILGKIIKLEFSQGGMPLIWIKYFKDGELEKTPMSELVGMVHAVDTYQ